MLALAARHPDDGRTPRCRSRRSTPRAGSASCWPAASDSRCRPSPPPDDFQATLRPYQQRGLSWLAFLAGSAWAPAWPTTWAWARRCSCWRWSRRTAPTSPTTGPTLLVCPMSVVGNWQREAARFAPALRVYVHHGPSGCAASDFAARRWRRPTWSSPPTPPPPATSTSWPARAGAGSCSTRRRRSRTPPPGRPRRCAGCAAGHRVALTGTPVENRLAELWSIMDFLNPGLLGSPASFRTRYADPDRAPRRTTEPAQRLRTITRPFVLRRLKTDPSDHRRPARQDRDQAVLPLTAEQASLYQAVVDDMLDKIENPTGIERRGHVLAAMAKLKQVCNHPAHFLHDRSRARAALRQADPARGAPRGDPRRGRQGAVLHAVHRVRRAAAAAPAARFGTRGAVPARRHAEDAPRRDGRPVPVRRRPAASSCCR